MPPVSPAATSSATATTVSSSEQPTVSRLIRGTSRFIYAILAGSSLVYLAVVLNKIYVAFHFVPLAESHQYIAQLLSSYILPLLAGQAVFFLAVYFEWQRKKKALLEAHRQELNLARQEAALQSTQNVVGFISEHVTANNAEILKWVQFRKGQKQQVSERVDRASHSIARAMQALSELAFVYPYTQKQVQPQAVVSADPSPQRRLETPGLDRTTSQLPPRST